MRWRAVAFALLLSPAVASADDVNNRLASYEAEVRQLGTELLLPADAPLPGRGLVDGIVAYELGDYTNAATMLLEISSTSTGPDKETATFYLAESLYAKGDRGGARTYFAQLTDGKSLGSKYYQPALLRQVEIAIAQHESADQPLALLDQISPSQRQPNVNYVKAKYAFSQDKYDESLSDLAEVPQGTVLELQIEYYKATIYVAKQDFAKATEIFTDLIGRAPKTMADRRVIELAQLALGRLNYQQEQFSRAVDSYLMIDRHSDVFPDALYEVSWVYVKNKQYDKALRALELLATSRPQASETPTVRLLEGNLHIRKAQRLREVLINGIIEGGEKVDPAAEYEKAEKVFEATRTDFAPAYATLTKLIDDKIDPGQYLDQLSNRNQHIYKTSLAMPEAAADLLRDESDVHRLIQVESDLAQIKAHLDEVESNVDRIDALLATGDTSTLYPLLTQKRTRVLQLEDALIAIRNDLADQQEKLVTPSGDLPQLAEKRHRLAQQFASYGDSEKAYAERRSAERAAYAKMEQVVGEAGGALDTAEAMALAVRNYAASKDSKLTPDQAKTAVTQLDAEAPEANSIEDEIAKIRKEIDGGRDLAGLHDADITAARMLRRELMTAQDAELLALAGFAAASRDANHSRQLAETSARASRVIDQLRIAETSIERHVAEGVAAARQELVAKRAELVADRAELTVNENEAHDLGAIVLVAAFQSAKAKLDDIVTRADVGTIDTSWAQKSDADDDLKRLNLTRARELKQLKDEFRDILDAGTKKVAKKPVSDMPAADASQTTLSPDKGGNTRIAPLGSSTTAPATPKIKPDEPAKPDDKKKGGSK